MLSRLLSAAVQGIEGFVVRVELDLSNGLPAFVTVGLPDSSVREARDRVVSAVRNSGYEFPGTKLTVNLAPARLRKAGTHLELPMALGVLAASGQARGAAWTKSCCVLGELALDGSVRPVSGVLPMAAAARAGGCGSVLLPRANAREAAVTGLRAHGVGSLREAVELLAQEQEPKGERREEGAHRSAAGASSGCGLDLSDVRGQALARRALEISAAGGHNLLMVGPPGTGKSMLAKRLPGILPPLGQDEAVEVTKVHSVAGLLRAGAGLMRQRPFRAPHVTASTAALVGGGPRSRPGELSLAHKGVLFLDEFPEFRRDALEALRQPLEDRSLTVARMRETVTFPADFTLVAAMNPCPCGRAGMSGNPCACPEPAVRRYRSRVSGPLLDRLDIRIDLAPLPFKDWAAGNGSAPESSAAVGERVRLARATASARAGRADASNARLSQREMKRHCRLDAAGLALVERHVERGSLSARGIDRMLRLARTIADLAGSPRIEEPHMAEALFYRGAGEG